MVSLLEIRFLVQGVLFIVGGFFITIAQNAAVQWVSGADKTQVHIIIFFYILGYFGWSIIYFTMKYFRKEEDEIRKLSVKKFIGCFGIVIVDFIINSLGILTATSVERSFDNYLRGLELPYVALLLKYIFGESLRRYQKTGAILTFAASILTCIVGSIYYIKILEEPMGDFGWAIGCTVFLFIFQGLYFLLIDRLCRSTQLDFQPREIIAYLGIWEFILACIIITVLNQPIFKGEPYFHTLDGISIILTSPFYVFVVFILLPVLGGAYNIFVVRIIREHSAAVVTCLDIIRSATFFLILAQVGESPTLITSLQTSGSLFIIYGCLIYLYLPITPKFLIDDDDTDIERVPLVRNGVTRSQSTVNKRHTAFDNVA